MMSLDHTNTPKRIRTGIDDEMMQIICPPPPLRLLSHLHLVDILAPTQEISDAPPGFFLVAPCNSITNNATSESVSTNHHFMLKPKKPLNNNQFADTYVRIIS